MSVRSTSQTLSRVILLFLNLALIELARADASGSNKGDFRYESISIGEALSARTRLTLFSDDKPYRLFTVITFLIDAVSGVALDLETGVPCYQVEDGLPRHRLAEGGKKAESIYCSSCQSKKRTKTAGASGGPIKRGLIPHLF